MKDIVIPIQLIDQNKATRKINLGQKEGEIEKNWSRKSCAICSLKMAISALNGKIKNISVMNLIEEGLSMDGFLKNIGWKHNAIVKISKKHGIKMYRMFCKKTSYRKKGISTINFNIRKKLPVLASIYYNLDKTKGGHVVVINGFRVDSKNKVYGYYIVDPDHLNRNGNRYFLPIDKFKKNWRGGVLYFKKP